MPRPPFSDASVLFLNSSLCTQSGPIQTKRVGLPYTVNNPLLITSVTSLSLHHSTQPPSTLLSIFSQLSIHHTSSTFFSLQLSIHNHTAPPVNSTTMNAPATTQPDTDVQAIREVLEEAIAQRGRYYTNYFSFSIRFETDNTSASRDTAHFQDIMKLLGLPKARELVIENTFVDSFGSYPGFER
jgi:hypothetical protein